MDAIDGDTLKLTDSSYVRLINIDAPEKQQPFGVESKNNLKILIRDKACVIHPEGKDKYQRTLAVVICDGQNINYLQVAQGFAWAYRKYSNDPKYLEAEQVARTKRLGLWVDLKPVEPWAWRKQRRERSDDNTSRKSSRDWVGRVRDE